MARNARNTVSTAAAVNVAKPIVEEIAPMRESNFVSKEAGYDGKLTFNFERYTDAASIDKGLTKLDKDMGNAQVMSHELVVAAIQHYVKCGDYTRLERCFTVIQHRFGNSRYEALKAYLQNNVETLIASDKLGGKSGKTKVGIRLTHVPGKPRTFVAADKGLLAVPYWELEKGLEVIDFNFKEALETLLRRGKGVVEKVAKAKNNIVFDANEKPIATVDVQKLNVPNLEALIELGKSWDIDITKKRARAS